MTVADNTSRNQYTATSGQTVFAYTFEIVDKDHIVVLQNGTALSEGTDYTVSNVGNDNGGNVTLTSGATAGDVMTLYRDMPYSRTQNYTNSGDFLASEVNADFDELWLAGEQTDRSFSQSIRKPITDSDSISMELPEAADRANKFVKFDATGAVDVAGATVTVSAEDVSIDDAGNYYTSDNVEGALQEVGASLDTKLENVVEDTTPQLGGNLDVNGNDITGTGNIDLTGSLDVSGTATVGAVTYTGTDGTDGQVLMTNGAGVASFEDMPSSTYLDVKDFGATGDGSTDDTTAIQNAINHASNNEIQTIFFPDGHYKYTTLRFYHDATDNPNFQETPNRDGRFQLRGTGRLAITDLKNVGKSPNRIYGAILESTSTGDGLIVEPTGTFQTTTDARNFVVKDLTLVADNTGYIVTAESCPGLTFDHCSFKQLNHQGSGILARNCWFFTMNQCYVFGQSWIDEDFATAGQTEFSYTFDNPASTSDIIVQKKGGLVSSSDYSINTTTKVVTLNTGADLNDKVTISRKNTGDGISSQFVGSAFGSFAGLWNITDSLVDSWANGVHWTGGQVTNLSLRNTGVQNCNNYNIYGDAGVIQQMLLDNVYMENQSVQGVSFIKGDGSGTSSATIRNLRMINCFMLAGGTFPRVTGTCIDIDSIEVIDIEGMYVFRMRQPFLNITATKNLQNVPGEIKNSLFATDQDLSAEPTIYLLSGKIPNVHNCVWPGFNDGFYDTTNDILLFDPSIDSNFPRQFTDIKGTTGTAKFGFGDTKVVTGITSGPYNITGSNSRTYYDLTHSIAGGLKVILPDTGEVNDGRLIIIKNNEASTSTSQFPYINVVNNSDQNTTIGRLSPGQAGLFVLDQQNSTEFKYVGRTFTDDLELTDDHKITFGRGTSAGPDMEIYHDSTSGESRIDTLAGLTLDGLTYPTADGTSGQSIITDGSGNLTFGTAAGTGITAVVEDTTPQLGGDLQSNGNDILFADNDKAIFGAGSDLQIYHDGSNSYIQDAGTGQIRILGDDVRIMNAAGTEISAQFIQDGQARLKYDNSTKLATTSTGIDVTGSINTVLSVDGTTEDVFITGAVPALEFVESDTSGSRMRMAWNTSGSFSPTLYQSLYGDSTTTYGGINIQTRASDGSGNQVVYAYDPINDRNWWGTRAAGDVRMQLQSNGDFNVRGGDVIFENSAQTSDDFYWDASTSRLGLGTTLPSSTLDVKGELLVTGGGSGTILVNDEDSSLCPTMTFTRNGGGTITNDFIKFKNSGGEVAAINAIGGGYFSSSVGIGTSSPARDLHIVENDDWAQIRLEGNSSGGAEIMMGDSTTESKGRIQYVNASNYMRFDTNATERMRIDSSGNLLVGKSSSAFGTAGVEINQNGVAGKVFMTRSGGDPLSLNRLSSDGEIQGFYKDGTQVGSIGTEGGALYISSPYGTDSGLKFASSIIAPSTTTGANRDAAIDLGYSSSRFKDLYLSGTAYSAALNVDGGSSGIINFGDVTSNYGRLYADSTGTYVGSVTANPLILRTTNTERARIDSSGNLLVGTTVAPNTLLGASSTQGLAVNGSSGYLVAAASGQATAYFNRQTSDGAIAEFRKNGTTVGSIGCNNNDPYIARAGGNGFRWYSGAVVPTNDSGATADNVMDLGSSIGRFKDLYLSNAAYLDKVIGHDDTNTYISFIGSDVTQFVQGGAESMRITAAGDLLVGKSTTAVGTAGFNISSTGSMTASIASGNAYHVYDTTNSAYRFYVSSAGQINATSTSITAISDESLKQNIRDLDKGLDTVLALQPRRFDWKNGDGNDIMGFVAQEVEEVMPELVHDYQYTETETKLGLKMGDMVPTLVKAIQDQQEIIENLKSRIEQLEGAN